MGITGISTEFIPHGTYARPPVNSQYGHQVGNGRYDGGDTPLAGHDLTDICYPQTLVCSCFLRPTSSLSLPPGAWGRLGALDALEASTFLPLGVQDVLEPMGGGSSAHNSKLQMTVSCFPHTSRVAQSSSCT